MLQCVAVDICIRKFGCEKNVSYICKYGYVLQCVAVCCSVLQCVAVCCSVLPLIFVYGNLGVRRMYLIYAHMDMCCSVLQCVAVCCH